MILPGENGEIELPYHRNAFRISFSVPDYAQNGQVEYAYKIEGLEREWVNIGEENQITLRNMPFGTYTFRVKARLRNGEVGRKECGYDVCPHPSSVMADLVCLDFLRITGLVGFVALDACL